jgi:SAM-dependent methyltransferase
MLRRLYRGLLNGQNDPSRQVGWVDRLQQFVAFEVLAGVGDLCGPDRLSVLDVGCGLGDLLDYLRGRGFAGRYTGVDLVPELIEAARARYPVERDASSPAQQDAGSSSTTWIVADILDPELALEPHDYVVASGLFDYRTPDSAKRLPRTVRHLFDLCRRGLAWNVLNVAPADRDDLYRAPPGDLLELCEVLTPWFLVRGDYDPHALTFYLFKRDHFVNEGLLRLIGRLYLDADARAQVTADPLRWAADYGLTLQQLNVLSSLLQGASAGHDET